MLDAVTISTSLGHIDSGDPAILTTIVDKTNDETGALIGAAWNKYILDHMNDVYDPKLFRLDLEKLKSAYYDLILHYGFRKPGTFHVKGYYGSRDTVNVGVYDN